MSRALVWLLLGAGAPALAQEAPAAAEGSGEDAAERDEAACEEVDEDGQPLEGEALEAACAEEPAPPVVEYGYFTTTLENGLKVSVLSDPDHPVVATQVWVQVGSAHEGPQEAGFAHLFEHFMFGDTANYGREVYAGHHTRAGGSENAYTAFDNTVYISEIPPEHHDFVLQLEADRLVSLVLDQENLANEQKIVTEELRLRTENDPYGRLLISALAGFFGEHPYGHSPAGTKEDIQAADLELARKFYEGYYRPANLHLVVVGPVSGPATLEAVERYFGGLPTEHTEPPEIPLLEGWDFPERVELKDDIPPIKLAARVYPVPAPGGEGYWAFRVLAQMLSDGTVDRFREDLVEDRGRALEAGAFHADQFRAGGLMVFASVNLPFRSKRRALKLVGQSVDNLSGGEWLSEENLAIARRALLRQELEGRYFAASQADDIGRAYAWMGDDQLGVDGFADKIDAVTLDEVAAAWDRYIAGAEPVEIFIKRGKPESAEGR